MVEPISALREPPVPGKFYLVPVVDYSWCGRSGIWPVLGALQTDVEHFNFPDAHYHIDPRFLTSDQAAFAARQAAPWFSNKIAAAVGARPLSSRGLAHQKGMPRLAKRRCRNIGEPYVYENQPNVQSLRADYSDPAQPIRKADGRLLCPHRKVDLSSFAPDAEGVVTCPLHGLRVQCGHGAEVA